MTCFSLSSPNPLSNGRSQGEEKEGDECGNQDRIEKIHPTDIAEKLGRAIASKEPPSNEASEDGGEEHRCGKVDGKDADYVEPAEGDEPRRWGKGEKAPLPSNDQGDEREDPEE